jgi:hypothetical protein
MVKGLLLVLWTGCLTNITGNVIIVGLKYIKDAVIGYVQSVLLETM